MSKLHELLAVSGNIDGQAQKTLGELISTTFDKKRHLFGKSITVFTPKDESQQAQVEAQSNISTSVYNELQWVSTFLIKRIDTEAAIAEANTQARADIIIEDRVIAKDVPATLLLELEKRIAEVQKLVAAIPTLDSAKGFEFDFSEGAYKARRVTKTRTRKMTTPVVKYPHTEQHPAQVEMVTEDVPVGTVVEQEWSTLIPPSEKSQMLCRVETLLQAVKAARSRANNTEVEGPKLGSTLLRYVFGEAVFEQKTIFGT